MKKILILFILPVLLVSCASSYKGGAPNFSLKGEEAKEEVKRYTLQSRNRWSLYLGNKENKSSYNKESLLPLMESISPEAKEQMKESFFWERMFWIPALASFAFLFLDDVIFDNGKDNISDFTIAAAIGSSMFGFGLLLYSDYTENFAIEKYNKDLKSKFIPSLTFNFNY